MGKSRRGLPEINSSSMADIAFLLLVFFLVTTTMDSEWGITRLLPPPDEDIEPPKFHERNVFVVLANANDQLLVEGELLDISNLREKAKEFIVNPQNKEDLPEKEQVTVAIAQQKMAQFKSNPDNRDDYIKWKKRLEAAKVLGEFSASKQVISLQNDRGTSYNLYIQVHNELAAAYREVREEFSNQKFGKSYEVLTPEQHKAVKSVIPQRISEAEPKNVSN
ncbi:MAG: biopolymer transporter ExbD [Flavobacteriales bacterium]|nr:MAG: biopolymer transporter ExbD [Flavobacteriales bacterium]